MMIVLKTLNHSYYICEFNHMEGKDILGRIGFYFGGFGERLN